MKKRIAKILIITIASACLFLSVGFIILNSIIPTKIRQQFAQLSPALEVKFASVHANIFSSTVAFDSLRINFIPYGNLPENRHSLYFPHASLSQISFFKFLINKELVADNFILDEGEIHLDQFLLEKRDSAQSAVIQEIKWPFKKLSIRNVELKRASAFIHAKDQRQLLAKGDIVLGGIAVNKPGGNPEFTSIDLSLTNLNCLLSDYRVQGSKLIISSRRKIVEVDSLQFYSSKQHNEAMISSIKITGFNVMELLNNRVLQAEQLMVGESKLAIYDVHQKKAEGLPFDLKKINVDDIRFTKASVSYKYQQTVCSFTSAINLQKVNITSLGKDGFDFGSVTADLRAVRYTGASNEKVEINKIILDSRKDIAVIEDVKITPRFGKYELATKLGHQADWLNASVSKIEILRPNIRELLHQKINADKILIGESNAYIFRDRRLPRPQKIIPLPAAYLKTLPFDIRIKTIELALSTVTYEEYPNEGYGQTGTLRIEKIRGSISPFINHPLASDPGYITMKVSGSVMGSGIAHAEIVMPLVENKPYRIRGAFENLELTKLNSSSENLGKIRIKSGFLDFLYFDFTMTDERSTGKIIGAYHHLIIQQLKKHTEEKNVADFASFVLRHAIIPLDKDASLPENKRTGLVNYQRDPTRMVTHYYLQSLLMGVKKSFALGFLLPK